MLNSGVVRSLYVLMVAFHAGCCTLSDTALTSRFLLVQGQSGLDLRQLQMLLQANLAQQMQAQHSITGKVLQTLQMQQLIKATSQALGQPPSCLLCDVVLCALQDGMSSLASLLRKHSFVNASLEYFLS